MAMSSPLIPVILSGGSGTRLWPMSRPQEPKQLLAMLDERTMLQATLDRLHGIDGVAAPIVVCAASHRELVASQVPPGTRLILEPIGRNTAPAVAAAAITAEAGGGGILLVLPADHVIRDREALRDAVALAVPAARAGHLVTFGIVPHYPETGYGYIHAGAAVATGVRSVEAFVEKPPLDVAEAYVRGGDHLWNSGMFVFRSDRYLEELSSRRPNMVASTRKALESGTGDPGARALDLEAFAACPSDSIDFAVMEHTNDAVVVPLEAGWDDVGSWSALWAISPHDADGNAIVGDVLAVDARDSYLRSEARLVAAVGIDGLIVVETADAVLVVPKAEAQRVKDVVATLKAAGRRESDEHLGHRSAWGRSDTLEHGAGYRVRRIEIAPDGEIGLESAPDRAETWVVVSGTAFTSHRGSIAAGASFVAPPRGPWTVANRTDEPAVVIVVELPTGAGTAEVHESGRPV
jgi:mannose-1-phosphate guanylyltransferase/mannose-6-phosphate isomerase